VQEVLPKKPMARTSTLGEIGVAPCLFMRVLSETKRYKHFENSPQMLTLGGIKYRKSTIRNRESLFPKNNFASKGPMRKLEEFYF
jgi:hypothetical protein